MFPEKLNYLVLVPKSISCNKYYISRLLSNVSSECEGPLQDFESSDFPGYVVLTKVDDADSLVWKGERVVFESTSEVTISLDHLEVGLVCLINRSLIWSKSSGSKTLTE